MVELKYQQMYIDEVFKIHGDKYNYSQIEYFNNKTMISIVCYKHGEFWKRADSFLKGSGCQKCFYENKSKIHRKDTLTFVQELTKMYGIELYNYDYLQYVNANTKVKILCKKHGWIYKTPKTLLQNSSLCHSCINRDTESFIRECNKIHDNFYDYSHTKYTRTCIKVHIICPKHGDFFQEARNHLNGSGCPICKTSKGEREIIIYLKKYGIKFDYQIKKYYENTTLIFDFYIPELQIYIEYDGKHHFLDSLYGTFQDIHKKDLIKDRYILENNLKLLRFHYLDFNKIDKLLQLDISNVLNYSRNDYYLKSQHIQIAGNPLEL